MTAIGSLSVDLELDRSRFDQEIKKLNNIKIKPLQISSALDSLKKQTEINVSVKSSGIDIIKNQIESIKNTEAKINISGNLRKIQDEIASLGSKTINLPVKAKFLSSQIDASGITSIITDSIKTGFQSVQGGGFLSLLTAPIQGAFSGMFLGFGLPLGQQIGQGVEKALQQAVGKSVGSFELLGQGVTERFLELIPITGKIAAEFGKEMLSEFPIIEAKIQQLQDYLKELDININIQDIAKEIADVINPQIERGRVARAKQFDQETNKSGEGRKAVVVKQRELVTTLSNYPAIVNQLTAAIAESKQEMQRRTENLTASLQNLEQAQAQAMEDPSSGNIEKSNVAQKNIEADIQASEAIQEKLQLLNAQREKVNKNYQESLQEAAELGIEPKIIQEIISAQSKVSDLQSVSANLSEAKSSKDKLAPETVQKAIARRDELQAKYATATPEEQYDIKGELAELSLITNDYDQLLQAVNQQIENLTQSISKGTQGLISILQTAEVPNIEKALQNEQQFIQSTKAGILQKNKKKVELQQKQEAVVKEQQKKKEIAALPTAYVDVFKQVAELSGVKADLSKIPKLIQDDSNGNELGAYHPGKNVVSVNPQAYEQLKSGDITSELAEILTHELRHALQFGFGKINAARETPGVELITPTAQEQQSLGKFIESSVQGGTQEIAATAGKDPAGLQKVETLQAGMRKLESDAYAFGKRNSEQIRANIIKEQIQSKAGVGAGKFKNDLTTSFQKVYGLQDAAKSVGASPDDILKPIQQEINDFVDSVKETFVEISNIDAMDATQLEGVKSKVTEISSTIAQLNEKISSAEQEIIQKIKPRQQVIDASGLIKQKIIESGKKLIAVEKIAQEYGIDIAGKIKPIQAAISNVIGAVQQGADVPSLSDEAVNSLQENLINSIDDIKSINESIANLKEDAMAEAQPKQQVTDISQQLKQGVLQSNKNLQVVEQVAMEYGLNIADQIEPIKKVIADVIGKIQQGLNAKNLPADQLQAVKGNIAKSIEYIEIVNNSINQIKASVAKEIDEIEAQTSESSTDINIPDIDVPNIELPVQKLEEDILKEFAEEENKLKQARKSAFKGKGKNKKIIDFDESIKFIQAIDNNINEIAEVLEKRKDLSPEARQTLGQTRGRLERQYRAYHPEIQKAQTAQVGQQIKQSVNAKGMTQQATQSMESSFNSMDKLYAFGIENFAQAVQKQVNNLMQKISGSPDGRLKQALNNFENDIEEQIQQINEQTIKEAAAQMQENLEMLENIAAKQLYTEQMSEADVQEEMKKIKELQQKLAGKYEGLEAPANNVVNQPAPEPPKPQQMAVSTAIRQKIREQTRKIIEASERMLLDLQSQLEQTLASVKEGNLIKQTLGDNEQRITRIIESLSIEAGLRGENRGQLSDQDFEELQTKLNELERIVSEDKIKLAQANEAEKNLPALQQLVTQTQAGIGAGKDILANVVTPEAVEKFNGLKQNMNQVFEQLQQPLPVANTWMENLDKGLQKVGLSFQNIRDGFSTFIKGFLAFQVIGILQNQLQEWFSKLSTEAFQAYVKLDNFRTALKFSVGGSIQASLAMKMITSEVERLGVALQPAREGFQGISAAAKNTSLEGEPVRELFLGIAEATTVLGLSADQATGIMQALTQMISKGRVAAEELRGQLGERLPGALGLAARSMGVTEAEFSRMLDSGQVISEEFLPRFAVALRSQFGRAAQEAAGNAQSAIFKYENAFQRLQESIGEGIAPAQINILNGLAIAFDFIAKNGVQLTQVITAISLILTTWLFPVATKFVLTLPLIQKGITAIGGALKGLLPFLKTMALQMIAIYGALEAFKLASLAFNGGDLSKTFNDMAKSAKAAAEAFEEATNAKNKFNKPDPKEPEAITWSDSIIFGARKQARNLQELATNPSAIKGLVPSGFEGIAQAAAGLVGKALGGVGALTTFAEQDRDKAVESIYNSAGEIDKAYLDVFERIKNTSLKTQVNQFDNQIQILSQQKRILQAELQRNFTDVGKTIPSEYKNRIVEINNQITKLSRQRTEATAPYTAQANALQQAIDDAKTQLKFLDSPDGKKAFAGQNITALQDSLKQTIKNATLAKEALDNFLANTNGDPLLRLVTAINKTNQALAEQRELLSKNTLKEQVKNNTKKIGDFRTNVFANEDASLDEIRQNYKDKIKDTQLLYNSVVKKRAEFKAPASQLILDELGVSADSSIALIEKRLESLPDGAKAQRQALEGLRELRQQESELLQAQADIPRIKLDGLNAREQRVLSEFEAKYQKIEADLQRRTSSQISSIKLAESQGKAPAETVNRAVQSVQKYNAQYEINIVKDKLREINRLEKLGVLSAKTVYDKKTQLINELTQKESAAIDSRIGAEQAGKQEALSQVEKNRTAMEAQATQLVNKQITTIKRALREGVINQQQAEEQMLDVKVDYAKYQIQVTKEKLKQVDALEKHGIYSRWQAEEQRIQFKTQLSEQELALEDLLAEKKEKNAKKDEKNAKKDEKRIKKDEKGIKKDEKGIKKDELAQKTAKELDLEAEKRKRLLDLKLADLNLDSKKIALLDQMADLEGKLLQSRAELAQTTLEANIAVNQISVNSLQKTLSQLNEIQGVLFSSKRTDMVGTGLQPIVNSLRAQAGSLGATSDSPVSVVELELKLLNQKQSLEIEIANNKLKALQNEQSLQQKLLELENKRNERAAQQNLINAQQSELEAKKRIVDAEIEIFKIQSNKELTADEKNLGITKARDSIKIADEELKISRETIKIAEKQVVTQQELNENSRKTLKIKQDVALTEEKSNRNNLKYTQDLEKIEQITKRILSINEATKNVLESRFNLSKALSDAVISRTEVSIGSLSKAEEILNKLGEVDISVAIAPQFQGRLNEAVSFLSKSLAQAFKDAGLTIDPTEYIKLKQQAQNGNQTAQNELIEQDLQILNKKHELENEAATQKMMALQAEHRLQQELFQLELKKTEAQFKQTELVARRNVLESERKIRQADTDEQEILNDSNMSQDEKGRKLSQIKESRRMAQEELKLSRDGIQIAQDAMRTQSEIASNAKEAMNAQQRSAESQQSAAHNAQKQAHALEKIEKISKKINSEQKNNQGVATPDAPAGNLNNMTFMVGSREHEQYNLASNMLSNAMKQGQQAIIDLLTSGAADINPFIRMKAGALGLGDLVQMSDKVNNSSAINRQETINQAQRNSSIGGDFINELKKLVDRVEDVGKRPSSLTVNSVNPVKDAAQIYNNINNANLRGNGL